jgi:mono/diheme cytochrome c family protein
MKRLGNTLALLAVVIAAACLDPLEPDIGPPLHPLCVNQDSDSGADVSYSADISSEVFARRCLVCHSPDGATPIGFEVAGLSLSSYSSLRAGGVVSGAQIVVPEQPCNSVLTEKIGAGPSFGARMPANGPPYLGDAEIQLINDWIAEGADND